jgi:hypothetical protein
VVASVRGDAPDFRGRPFDAREGRPVFLEYESRQVCFDFDQDECGPCSVRGRRRSNAAGCTNFSTTPVHSENSPRQTRSDSHATNGNYSFNAASLSPRFARLAQPRFVKIEHQDLKIQKGLFPSYASGQSLGRSMKMES